MLIILWVKTLHIDNWDLFGLWSLSGCILFAPPDARANFLNNDLLCNSTCSVIGCCITYWGGGGGHKRKRSINWNNWIIWNGVSTNQSRNVGSKRSFRRLCHPVLIWSLSSPRMSTSSSNGNEELIEAAQALIQEAKNLKADVELLTDTYGQALEGCQKLSRKIDAEIKFISQVSREWV